MSVIGCLKQDRARSNGTRDAEIAASAQGAGREELTFGQRELIRRLGASRTSLQRALGNCGRALWFTAGSGIGTLAASSGSKLVARPTQRAMTSNCPGGCSWLPGFLLAFMRSCLLHQLARALRNLAGVDLALVGNADDQF